MANAMDVNIDIGRVQIRDHGWVVIVRRDGVEQWIHASRVREIASILTAAATLSEV